MISATIMNIILNGPSVSVEYVLTDDQDPSFSQSGTIQSPIGSSQSDINTQLIPIIDAANYAQSLKPLINTQVESPNAIPAPVQPNPVQQVGP